MLVLFINLFHQSGFIEVVAAMHLFLLHNVMSCLFHSAECSACAVGDNGILVLPPRGACVFASTYKLFVSSWGLHYDNCD